MSLQLQTPQPQPKQSHVICTTKATFCATNHTLVPSVSGISITPVTLDLFDTKQSPPRLEFLDAKSKQKRRWEDQSLETMSRRNVNNTPKLDLRLNLSPPRRVDRRAESPSRSASVSPPSSCVSSDMNNQDGLNIGYSNSPEATSMVLVGCPRCLMYVMLSEDDPKCPKCKSTVLLDFMHENNDNNNHNCSNSGSSKKTRKN